MVILLVLKGTTNLYCGKSFAQTTFMTDFRGHVLRDSRYTVSIPIVQIDSFYDDKVCLVLPFTQYPKG